jgi:isopentenyl-diphosphate Delta-isomerase
MKIQIVNDKDEIIGIKDRGNILDRDIYRVSALWITNSKGQILLAKRSLNKKNDPGLWGPAVAGTVEEYESYEANIIKEAREEIGVGSYTFNLGPKMRVTSPHNHFTQWFTLVIDKPLESFNIQKEEVDKIQWFDKDELLDEMQDNPDKFIKSLVRDREIFFNLS